MHRFYDCNSLASSTKIFMMNLLAIKKLQSKRIHFLPYQRILKPICCMNKRTRPTGLSGLILLFSTLLFAQNKPNDVTTPLHLLQPDYPVPYGVPSVDSVKEVLDRIYNYLNSATPAQFVNRKTNEVVTN